MAMTLRVVVPPHPLIGHWLSVLRQRETPAPLFATAMQELGRWLSYEALRDWLPHRQDTLLTANGPTQGTVVEAGVPLLAIPLLPAGLELWHGARSVLPAASLCLDGLPTEIEANAGVIIYVDQINDGEQLLPLLQGLQQRDVAGRRLRLITALAANAGLKRVGEAMPDLNIHTACIDPDLTAEGLINPGIGDPVQRLAIRSAQRS